MTISECSKIVDAIIKMDVRRCKNNKKSKAAWGLQNAARSAPDGGGGKGGVGRPFDLFLPRPVGPGGRGKKGRPSS